MTDVFTHPVTFVLVLVLELELELEMEFCFGARTSVENTRDKQTKMEERSKSALRPPLLLIHDGKHDLKTPLSGSGSSVVAARNPILTVIVRSFETPFPRTLLQRSFLVCGPVL